MCPTYPQSVGEWVWRLLDFRGFSGPARGLLSVRVHPRAGHLASIPTLRLLGRKAGRNLDPVVMGTGYETAASSSYLP